MFCICHISMLSSHMWPVGYHIGQNGKCGCFFQKSIFKVIHAQVKILKSVQKVKKRKVKVPSPDFLSTSVLSPMVSTIKTFFCVLLGIEKHVLQNFIRICSFFTLQKLIILGLLFYIFLKNYY